MITVQSFMEQNGSMAEHLAMLMIRMGDKVISQGGEKGRLISSHLKTRATAQLWIAGNDAIEKTCIEIEEQANR